MESQQRSKQQPQSRSKNSNSKKKPSEVGKIDFSLNGIWTETVVHKLLDALRAQHQALEEVSSELEAERNASANSIDDALLMISRLQKEKSRLAMEHTHYRRETEQMRTHVKEALAFYEDLLFKKDEEIKALRIQVQAYRNRLFSYGVQDFEIDEIGLPGMPLNGLGNLGPCIEDCQDYSGVSMDIERIGSRDSADFRAQNSGGFENIGSEGNSSMDSCRGGDSAYQKMCSEVTMGLSTSVQVKGGDGDLKIFRKYDNEHVNPKCEYTSGNALERPTMLSEAYHSGCSPLCEVIEGFRKARMRLLSEKKEMSSDLENEWRLADEELQSVLTAYINSLGQGSKSRRRVPFSEPLEAPKEDEEADRFLEVHVDTEEIRDLHQKADPLSQRYEEDSFTPASIGENGILEEVAETQMVTRVSIPVTGLPLASLTKYILSGLFVGVRGILSSIFFRSYKLVLHRRW